MNGSSAECNPGLFPSFHTLGRNGESCLSIISDTDISSSQSVTVSWGLLEMSVSDGMDKQDSPSRVWKEGKHPGLHSGEEPFIINVKTEESG